MKLSLISMTAASASALQLTATVPLRVAGVQRASKISMVGPAPPAGFVWAEDLMEEERECLVDAENAAEQAECLSGRIDTLKTEGAAAIALRAERQAALAECLVDAENSAEQADCVESWSPTVVKWGAAWDECLLESDVAKEVECLSRMEALKQSGAAVIAMREERQKALSAEPTPTVAAAGTKEMLMGYGTTDIGECLVDAENAAEVQECNDDYDKLVQ